MEVIFKNAISQESINKIRYLNAIIRLAKLSKGGNQFIVDLYEAGFIPNREKYGFKISVHRESVDVTEIIADGEEELILKITTNKHGD